MSKKLAIKEHRTHGKKVIKLLEMMSGKNIYDYNCDCMNNSYYVCNHTILCDRLSIEDDDFVILTLEEFLEKFPFKVGDKVVYTKFGDNCDDYPVTIESMKWTGTTVEYTFNDCVTCLAKDLKMWNGEPDTVISGIYLNSCDYADEVELYLGDYEIEVRDGKTYAVLKKPKYPTTYEECCEILGIGSYFEPEIRNATAEECRRFTELIRLKRCRNAYWKIAGDWKPDWNNIQDKHCIYVVSGELWSRECQTRQCTLAFPTAEMRDTFYENFKDLIEQCKELL